MKFTDKMKCPHYPESDFETSECPYCQLVVKAKHKVFFDTEVQRLKAELRAGKCKDRVLQESYDLMEMEVKDVMHEWYFITVNPRQEEFGIDAMQSKIMKLTNKKFVKSMKWCYEQRGESVEDMGTGAHCHILLQNDGSRDDNVRRCMYTLFQSMCGSKHHINIKRIREKWVEDKVKYMSGEKWDEQKDLKCEIDKVWRESLDIDGMYEYSLPN